MDTVDVDVLNVESYKSPEPEEYVASTQGPQFSDLFSVPSHPPPAFKEIESQFSVDETDIIANDVNIPKLEDKDIPKLEETAQNDEFANSTFTQQKYPPPPVIQTTETKISEPPPLKDPPSDDEFNFNESSTQQQKSVVVTATETGAAIEDVANSIAEVKPPQKLPLSNMVTIESSISSSQTQDNSNPERGSAQNTTERTSVENVDVNLVTLSEFPTQINVQQEQQPNSIDLTTVTANLSTGEDNAKKEEITVQSDLTEDGGHPNFSSLLTTNKVSEKQQDDHDDDEFDFETPVLETVKTETKHEDSMKKQEPTVSSSNENTSKVPESNTIKIAPKEVRNADVAKVTTSVEATNQNAAIAEAPAEVTNENVAKPEAPATNKNAAPPKAPAEVTNHSVAKPEAPAQVTNRNQETVDDLAQAQDEWAAVQTITPEIQAEGTAVASKANVETSPIISFTDAYEHSIAADMSQYKGQINTSVHRTGFKAFKHTLFGPPKLHRDLLNDRDNAFCFAQYSFSNDDPQHLRILQTIYKRLTGSKFDCQRFGRHWEQIGFQGNDPSTDLRGCGMLGLLQLLYMLTTPKYLSLARDMYKLSLHETQNFPFCVMGINMTRMSIQALREDCLNKECNRQHGTTPDGSALFSVLNQFYVATFLRLYTIWKTQHKTIANTGFVLKDVEAYVKKNASRALNDLQTHLQQQKQLNPATDREDIPVEEPVKFSKFNET